MNRYLDLLKGHGVEFSEAEEKMFSDVGDRTEEELDGSEGVAVGSTVHAVAGLEYNVRCDGQVIEDRKNGIYVCMKCGMCLNEKIIVYEPEYHQGTNAGGWANPLGSQSGVTFKKKRFYSPTTHFKEHLRRYMGARFRDLPENLIEELKEVKTLNVECRDAYFQVKQELKVRGYNKYYKEIYTIIYLLGGVHPKVSMEQYEECVRQFKVLMFYFFKSRSRFGRYSMPSMYMVMEFLLKRNGHEPYYTIPHLKDDELRARVVSIYNSLFVDNKNVQGLFGKTKTVC
jgi:hypothetical protein